MLDAVLRVIDWGAMLFYIATIVAGSFLVGLVLMFLIGKFIDRMSVEFTRRF